MTSLVTIPSHTCTWCEIRTGEVSAVGRRHYTDHLCAPRVRDRAPHIFAAAVACHTAEGEGQAAHASFVDHAVAGVLMNQPATVNVSPLESRWHLVDARRLLCLCHPQDSEERRSHLQSRPCPHHRRARHCASAPQPPSSAAAAPKTSPSTRTADGASAAPKTSPRTRTADARCLGSRHTGIHYY